MKRMMVKPRICKREDGTSYVEMDQEEIEVTTEETTEETPYFSFKASFTKEEMHTPKEEFVKILDEKIEQWKDLILWQNELIIECEKIEKDRKE